MSDANSTEKPVVYKEVVGFPGYRVGDDGSIWTSMKKIGGKGKGWTIGNEWKRMKVCLWKKLGRQRVMQQVKEMLEQGMSQVKIGKIVGLRQSSISRIKLGLAWNS